MNPKILLAFFLLISLIVAEDVIDSLVGSIKFKNDIQNMELSFRVARYPLDTEFFREHKERTSIFFILIDNIDKDIPGLQRMAVKFNQEDWERFKELVAKTDSVYKIIRTGIDTTVGKSK